MGISLCPPLLPLDQAIHEKSAQVDIEEVIEKNPVVDGAQFALDTIGIVKVDDDGVKTAAKYIHARILLESYTPRTWRTHELHICPPEPYSATDPATKETLNWIFLISALNFSFWSESEGQPYRYGVEWRDGWDSEKRTVWTGYWSLVAALNRALEEEIPITDPAFYSSEILCPDSLIEHIFRPADQCNETIPLLKERIAIMREVGSILCTSFSGSFQGFFEKFQRLHNGQGTALELVKMVTTSFPSFQDEAWVDSRKVCLWKRAQILVAETWAAFYPPEKNAPHPLFPGSRGPAIGKLTMFADYRVPQILHHLRVLDYPPPLVQMLQLETPMGSGCAEEVSIRAASIIAVERIREEILKIGSSVEEVSSVLIDFYLWDLAKKIEGTEEKVEGIETTAIVPTHRTRSIWY